MWISGLQRMDVHREIDKADIAASITIDRNGPFATED
jgi:hypothetical protein